MIRQVASRPCTISAAGRVACVLPLQKWRQFRGLWSQGSAEMQGSPEDDVFGDFAGRAAAWQRTLAQLLSRQRRDGEFERVLIFLPAEESAGLGDCGPCCHGSCSLE